MRCLRFIKKNTDICKAIIEKRDFNGGLSGEGFCRKMYPFLGNVYQIADIYGCIDYQKVYLQSFGEPFAEPYYFNAKWINKFANDFEIIDRDRLEDLI